MTFKLSMKRVNTTTCLHKDGEAIYLTRPMNQVNFHSVPKCKKIEGCRISWIFCEIVQVFERWRPALCLEGRSGGGGAHIFFENCVLGQEGKRCFGARVESLFDIFCGFGRFRRCFRG